ncbi:DUF4157 domain-containing protein [Cellulomonas sp. URHD0024]|uniref:eCIS core domain-containing protein n=1 Tax=Cellulomonas sp. URHD0024 TaxID=1302620 RepID=UPI0004107A37|nr:DUF4157 domain-containing protein [Cellulomonas sp. URHD0024]
MGTEATQVQAVPAARAEVLPASSHGAAPAALVPLSGLTVGHAEDAAERDADERADSALERLRRASPAPVAFGGDDVRRSAAPSSGAIGLAGGPVDAPTTTSIERLRGRGNPLPTPVRGRMEQAFGTSFGGVRIHTGGEAAGLSASMSAAAFTTGRDVFFGRGQFAPDTPGGERVLAHELAHTLQPDSGSLGRIAIRRQLTDKRVKEAPVVVDIAAIPHLDTAVLFLTGLVKHDGTVASTEATADAKALKARINTLVLTTDQWDTQDVKTAESKLDEAMKQAAGWKALAVLPADAPTRPLAVVQKALKDIATAHTNAESEAEKVAAECRDGLTAKAADINYTLPATRNYLLKAKATWKNKSTNHYKSALASMRAAGETIGLLSFDRETVAEWKKVEALKGRTTTARSPIDEVLKKHVAALKEALPTATLNYRGSLASGMKSPKKVVPGNGPPALVEFDKPFAEVDSERGTRTTNEAAAFDVDVNVVAPDLSEYGLWSGPLSKGRPRDSEEDALWYYDSLMALQKAIKTDLLALGMPGLDLAGFEIYLRSTAESEANLSKGTPYPSYMLESAGLSGMAASLPQAPAYELTRRLEEYALSRSATVNNVSYMAPLSTWDPYFVALKTHIETKGPLAVYMPEVQVQVQETGARVTTARPDRASKKAEPSKLTENGFVQLKESITGPSQALVGAVLYGTVGEPVDSGTDVKVGSNKSGDLFVLCSRRGLAAGSKVIVQVRSILRSGQPSCALLKTLKEG